MTAERPFRVILGKDILRPNQVGAYATFEAALRSLPRHAARMEEQAARSPWMANTIEVRVKYGYTVCIVNPMATRPPFKWTLTWWRPDLIPEYLRPLDEGAE